MIKSGKIKRANRVDRMGDGRSAFKIVTGKPTRKKSLGRPRSRWEDNIKIQLREKGVNISNGFDSAQDRDYWGDPL